jgi:flavin reductase (DIM6/NTAB) family NADH-FMN oxidoreductase RutF
VDRALPPFVGPLDGQRPVTFVATSLEPVTLRRVFGNFPTGVTALAALVDGSPVGLALSSFTSVSLDPALVLVCVAQTSTTWPALANAARLGISVLAVNQEQACRQLSAPSGDRFAGLAWRTTDEGAVFLEGASAWLECSLEQQFVAGDHNIVVLRVHELDGDHAVSPLVFHGSQLRQLMPAPRTLGRLPPGE